MPAIDLVELHPYLAGGFLRFDCPMCGAKGHMHSIRIPVSGAPGWTISGEFPGKLTLQPSVKCGPDVAGCRLHAVIVSGRVSWWEEPLPA